MGISAFDVLGKNPNNQTPQTPSTTPNSNGGGSAFDVLPTEQPKKELGFWDKIGNVIDNLPKDPLNPLSVSPLTLKIAQANSNGKLQQAAALAGDKLKDTFTTSKGVSDLVSDVASGAKSAISQVWDNPTGTIKNIPSSLLDMATTPIAALSGVDISQPNAPELSTNDRVQAIKDTAGQIALGLVTEGAGSAISKIAPAAEKLGIKAALAKPVEDLSNIASTNVSAPGALVKNMVKNGFKASAGGAAYGMVSGAGDEDQIAKTVGSAMMFAPLGAVAGGLFEGKGKDFANKVDNKNLATNIQNWRKVNFDLNDSIKDIDTKQTSIITSDDLADAVIKNQVLEAKNRPLVIEGVTKDKLSSLPPDLNYNVETHGVGDKVNVLLTPKDAGPLDTSSFKMSGFMNGEVVSHEGDNYIVNNASPTDLSLVGSGGIKKLVPINEVLRTDNGILLDPKKVIDQQYNQLKDKLVGDDGKLSSANADAVTNAFSSLDYPKQLEFSKRLANDVVKEADPVNRNILNDVYARFGKPREVSSVEDFINHAQTNGYGVEIGDAGKVILKDLNDPQGRVVGTGNTLNDAYDFVSKSGQAKGNNLISGSLQDGMAPAGVNRDIGAPPNVNRPEPIPFLQSPLSWSGNKVNQIDNTWKNFNNVANFTAHWLTPANDLMKSMDNRFGTRFHSQYFDPLQVAKQQSITNAAPWVDKLVNINKMASGMTQGDLEKVGNWMEAASPETIQSKAFSRPMNADEISAAKNLDDNEAIQKAFKYNRFLSDNPNPKTDDINAFTQGIGMDEKSLNFSKALKAMSTQDPSTMNMGYVVRLARAINDKAVDRPEFATANSMTPQHIAVGNALEGLNNDLGGEFNIPAKDRLNFYMTHARLYSAGDLQGAMNMFARSMNPEAAPFYAELAKTGEIDTYERNPLVAAYRYITSGFNARHFNPIEANAKQYLEQVMSSSLIPDAEKAKVRAINEGYLSDLKGRTPVMSAATQSAVDGFVKDISPQTSVDTRSTITKILKSVQVGTQGFKIGAGTRDFMNGSAFALYRFGPDRLASILTKGAAEVAGGNKLIENGHLTGMSLDRLVDPTTTDASVPSKILNTAGDAYSKFSELSLKASGQETAYNLLRQGAYMDTFSRVAQAARDLTTSGDKNQFFKDINLDKDFAPSIANEVRKQVEQQPARFDEISKYLARESARQITPTYGLGNNPSGWGRNIGKIAGQYGSYSSWATQALKEPLTTGSIGDRVMRLGRFGAYTGAIAAASASTGLNFSPWYIHRVGFSGGPLAQMGMNMWNAVGGSGYEAKNAQDQLSRLMPIDSKGDFHKQFYIPGSFAVSDMDEALNGNPASLIGLHPQK